MWHSEAQSFRTERNVEDFPVQPPCFQEELDTRKEPNFPFPVVTNWQGPTAFSALVTDPYLMSSTSTVSLGCV